MAGRQTLAAQTQSKLQEQIMTGVYPVGTYLPGEHALCEQFEVSRTTIRDAVGGLVEKGFLKREHGKGVLVIDKSSAVVADSFRNMMLRGDYSVSEFLETREMIERQIAYLAAKRATAEDIASMQDIIDKMRNFGENAAGDIDTYIRYDLEFHKSLARASKNKLLAAVYKAILPMLEQMVREVVHATGMVENDLKYHAQILEGIRKRDAQEAEEKAAEHDKASEKMFQDNVGKERGLDEIFFKRSEKK